MRKLWILAAVLAGVLTASPARAAIVLQFFVGTAINDTVINTGSPITAGTPLTVPTDGTNRFVQVVMTQTAPTTLLDATDGLAAYLVQAIYAVPSTVFVPATNGLLTGTTPVVNVADPGTYSLVRSYRTGLNGVNPGGTAGTATAFRFGGLNLNPPPSPSVDANGQIFLGTFALRGNNMGGSPDNTQVTLADPNPAITTIDNITDMGDNIDAVLFNGATYQVSLTVLPVPEPTSFVLAGLVATGAIGLRLRRKTPAAEKTEETAA